MLGWADSRFLKKKRKSRMPFLILYFLKSNSHSLSQLSSTYLPHIGVVHGELQHDSAGVLVYPIGSLKEVQALQDLSCRSSYR